MDEESTLFATSLEDFRRARRRAAMQGIMAKLTGQPVELLSFDDVRQKFQLDAGASRGVQDIPLDAVVGSVGRYRDFTRTFLPRLDNDDRRWARVKAAALDPTGLPPIEVYKFGEVYFVVDGNHRVSVAKEMNAPTIQAYVTEFKIRVPITPSDSPDDIIIKAEYANFLEKTRLDVSHPEANFQTTSPGRYWLLETQIEACRYRLGQPQKRDVALAEAVERWYADMYLPVVTEIHQHGILRDFPGRTETDLYIWIFQHRHEISQRLGWDIDLLTAASDLITAQSDLPQRKLARVEERLLDTILPDSLEDGPAPGQWRRDWLHFRPPDRLFANILVPIRGDEAGWSVVDLATAIARHEQGQLYGLHVRATDDQLEPAQSIQDEFLRRCHAAGIPGNLSIETGSISRIIIELARFADLVVLHLAHPPGTGPLQKLSSGLRTLIHRCPRPMLTVPGPVPALERALVAYDGSPKAQEALFVSAYMASRAKIELVVLTVTNQKSTEQSLAEAKTYLESRGAIATFVTETGDVTAAILQTAARYGSHVIVMGGYGFNPMLEMVLGSNVDQVLRESKLPVLICR